MRVGDMVKGNIDLPRIPGSPNREPLLSHKMGMFASERDTIELWDPESIWGMIVKIDKDISGYGPSMVQVLLKRRCVWFFSDDLVRIEPPKK